MKIREKPGEQGSGNVYADLGLSDADELYARARIGYFVFTILTSKKLGKRDIAATLGITPSKVTHLLNGQFSRFTTDDLLAFLKRLNQKVIIRVSQRRKGEPYQQVTMAV